MREKHFQNLTHSSLIYFAPDINQNVNQEPFPDFDLEINKEDKDSDIDNPKIRKKPDDEEKKDENNTNKPPSE